MADATNMPVVYSVTQLTQLVRSTLEHAFPMVDLEGEVGGFKVYPSGHAYFTLKDANSQLSAVMFKGSFDACDCRNLIRDGVQLKVRGSISIGSRSQYQFIVRRARLVGQGELMQKFLELKAKLEAEGLFASDRKRPLPFLPRRIGIVTSPSGAVIHDMCRVIMRRFPAVEIRLFASLVQGSQAPASIARGINHFNAAEDGWCPDLIIFGRGGGSYEDLFCFNDEQLVRTVAASRIPTISAVGHETDFTLCDFAADLRAGTPSMAAELAVPELSKLRQKLKDAMSAAVSSLRGKYEWHAQRTDMLGDALGTSLRAYHADAAGRVSDLASSLRLLGSGMSASCALSSQRVSALSESLSSALKLSLQRAESSLETLSSKLSLLSPYSVLERGYTLTTDASGSVVLDAADLRPGDRLHTRFRSGEVDSAVVV